jgi:hypothetical protein
MPHISDYQLHRGSEPDNMVNLKFDLVDLGGLISDRQSQSQEVEKLRACLDASG